MCSCVTLNHLSIEHVWETVRYVLQIQDKFFSMRYRGVYNFENPCISDSTNEIVQNSNQRLI